MHAAVGPGRSLRPRILRRSGAGLGRGVTVGPLWRKILLERATTAHAVDEFARQDVAIAATLPPKCGSSCYRATKSAVRVGTRIAFSTFVNAPVNHPAHALVVSTHTSARDNMVKSLRAARMGVFVTERIDGCVARIPAGTSLVVLFPDCFRFDQVVGALFALRRERPEVHAVLATEAPQRFARLVIAADNAPPPSVIQMPVSAWTILETVARAAAQYRRSGRVEIPSRS